MTICFILQKKKKTMAFYEVFLKCLNAKVKKNE